MTTKSYTVRFYQSQSGADNTGTPVSDILSALARQADPATVLLNGGPFELRALHDSQGLISGIFARVRVDDLPHAGAAGGNERELDLGDNEGLLEKTHFLYAKREQVLVFQLNRMVGTDSKFAAYLTSIATHIVQLNPILQLDAAQRLMTGNVRVREYDVAIARPDQNVLDDPTRLRNLWNKSMMQVMRDTGAYRMRFILKADGHSHSERRFLRGGLVGSLSELQGAAEVRRAKVKYESDEYGSGTVDLLADQIAATIEVEANGRYPNSVAMWAELRRAWFEHRDEVRRVLGLVS